MTPNQYGGDMIYVVYEYRRGAVTRRRAFKSRRGAERYCKKIYSPFYRYVICEETA